MKHMVKFRCDDKILKILKGRKNASGHIRRLILEDWCTSQPTRICKSCRYCTIKV